MYRRIENDEIKVDDRNAKLPSGVEVVHKETKSQRKFMLKGTKAPASMVSDIIEKNATKRGEEERGVWNPLGRIYTCNGNPDTNLVEMPTGDSADKKRRPKKAVPTSDYAESSKKMLKLQRDLKATQQQLKEWKLFNRQQDEPQEKKTTLVKKDEIGNAPRKKSTIEIISELGVEKKSKRKIIKEVKKDYDFASEKDPNTLIARWHQEFNKVKIKKEKELVKSLIIRQEDKDEVFRSKILRNNASYIVGSQSHKLRNRSRKSTRYSADGEDLPQKSSVGGYEAARRRSSRINVGDTCRYVSPTGVEEVVIVIDVADNKNGEEREFTLQPENSADPPFTAFGRYLRKNYRTIERRREPKKSVSEISLWEKAKLMKLKTMAIETPATHFVNRIRAVDLRSSNVGNNKPRKSDVKDDKDARSDAGSHLGSADRRKRNKLAT